MTTMSEQVPTQKPLARRKARSGATQSPKEAVNEILHEAIHYDEHLHERITKRAYEHYVERGYRDGCSLQDWLDAEREILSPEVTRLTLAPDPAHRSPSVATWS